MRIKKSSIMMLFALATAALLSGCGSSAKDGSPGNVARVADEGICITCHSTTLDHNSGTGIVADYAAAGHNPKNSPYATGCEGCHGGGSQHNGVGPFPYADPLSTYTEDGVTYPTRCNYCHNKKDYTGSASDHTSSFGNLSTLFKKARYTTTADGSFGFANKCAHCHTENRKGSVHGAGNMVDKGENKPYATLGCIDCHDIAAPQHGPKLLNDNNGIRAILPEFNKRSHHITGGAPTNAQCAVCHLAGKVVNGKTVVNEDKHMHDNAVHLRNADTNADITWSGTEHTNMDNFCFSCHDLDGAAGLHDVGLDTATGGSRWNPFGDTLTNGYDQVARPRVIDVKTAFTTTNASHHAVSGQRYTYRFSTVANAAAWKAANPAQFTKMYGTAAAVPASDIAEGHTYTINGGTVTSPFGTGLTFDVAGPEEGGDATLFEAGKFVYTYVPLGETLSVADNSIIHCGDCHTVGQWKAGSSTNADGSKTTAAIGAHGSNNDYLLRNSLGTDAIHNGLTYVCFNCHKADIVPSSNALWAELVAEGLINPSTVVSSTYLNCSDFGGYASAAKTACKSGAGVVVPVNSAATLGPKTWAAGWGSLHPTLVVGQLEGYYTAHSVSAFHAQCQADSADNITSNLLGHDVPHFLNFSSMRLVGSWSPQAVKAYDYLPAPGATAAYPVDSRDNQVTGSNTTSGNITGIACINCHNSGLRNNWGGIHGGNNVYTDGLGRTQTTYRFMPGMGNYRYAPPGGWTGKDVSDPTLLTANNPVASTGNGGTGFPGESGKPMGGCYTNGSLPRNANATADDPNPGVNGQAFSTCNHHGTSTAAPQTTFAATKTTVSGRTASFRTTYGGGTTGSPTTFEPTVREATAGGALVTRPLKY